MTKKQMLIVDDSRGIREALRTVFEEDYELSFAANGEEALKVAFKRTPEVVLMDYKMPGLDGVETMEYMQRIAPNTQMVIMSALDDRDSVAKYLRGGAHDFIGKPFELYELKEVVENAANSANRIMEFAAPQAQRKAVISQHELESMIDDTLKVACL